MRILSYSLALAAVTASLPSQGALRGNGFPAAYVETTPAVIGDQLVIGFGSPTQPNGFALLSLSGGYGPFPLPLPQLGGPIAIDPLHPAYLTLFLALDAQGHGTLTAPIVLDPALLGAGSYYVNALTFETVALWSVSKTAHIDWMLPDAWEPAGLMTAERQLHSATALGEGPRDNLSEVLICGGATGSFIVPTPINSAELFSPVTRSTTPLPNMSAPRTSHGTVRLADGRLLITGGVTTGGAVLATCEVFDPISLTFSAAPSMTTSRSGHAITVLDDGRVLVSGGVADWQNAAVQFITVLNTAQATAEVFDPISNTWTAVANMASARLGHTQTLLPDGRVLVVSGINGGYAGLNGGGQMPTYTTSCEVFNPSNNTFTATNPLTHVIGTPPFLITTYYGRALHSATVLANGNVLITGGFVAGIASAFANDETIATDFCNVWDAALGTWTQTAPLPATMAYHASAPHQGGVIVSGGFSGALVSLTPTAATAFHDGTTMTPQASSSSARAAHTMTKLCDGTLLVYGGAVWPSTLNTGEIYLPN